MVFFLQLSICPYLLFRCILSAYVEFYTANNSSRSELSEVYEDGVTMSSKFAMWIYVYIANPGL